MKSKLMAVLFVTVLGLVAAPLALEQLGHLKGLAERWARNTFLTGVTVHASGTSDATRDEQPAPLPVTSTTLQSSTDEFRWSGRIAQGNVVEIKGINGNVRAEPAAGGEVEVVAIKTGRHSDPKEVEIRVLQHANGVTICAVYPSSDPGRPNGCEAGSNWSSHTHNNDVSVNFTVRVPQGVRFSGKTINGDVETGALTSDVEASSVNGSIKVAAAGIASARTVNGSITASMGRANWTGPLRFETVNGGITLDLPSDTSADVRAETVNGDISTDFPLTILGRISRKHLDGTIGSGGRELSLKTVNGSIMLRRTS